jgi:hypothetical protein
LTNPLKGGIIKKNKRGGVKMIYNIITLIITFLIPIFPFFDKNDKRDNR